MTHSSLEAMRGIWKPVPPRVVLRLALAAYLLSLTITQSPIVGAASVETRAPPAPVHRVRAVHAKLAPSTSILPHVQNEYGTGAAEDYTLIEVRRDTSSTTATVASINSVAAPSPPQSPNPSGRRADGFNPVSDLNFVLPPGMPRLRASARQHRGGPAPGVEQQQLIPNAVGQVGFPVITTAS